MRACVRHVQVVAVAALIVQGLVVTGAAGEPLPAFAEVVERLDAVNPTLKSLIVDQNADVRWLGIFHFGLRTTVYAARPAFYKVVVHEAPAVLRPLGDTFYLVSSPRQVLADYTATSIDRRSDDTLVIELMGARPSVNPPKGRVVVDTRRWLVQEIALDYRWGQLQVKYRYGDVEGFLLPETVQVSLPGYSLNADFAYTGYQLNVPIDPAIFSRTSN